VILLRSLRSEWDAICVAEASHGTSSIVLRRDLSRCTYCVVTHDLADRRLAEEKWCVMGDEVEGSGGVSDLFGTGHGEGLRVARTDRGRFASGTRGPCAHDLCQRHAGVLLIGGDQPRRSIIRLPGGGNVSEGSSGGVAFVSLASRMSCWSWRSSRQCCARVAWISVFGGGKLTVVLVAYRRILAVRCAPNRRLMCYRVHGQDVVAILQTTSCVGVGGVGGLGWCHDGGLRRA